MIFILAALVMAAVCWIATAKPEPKWMRWEPNRGWSWSA